jgi:hypothetical protein
MVGLAEKSILKKSPYKKAKGTCYGISKIIK